MIKVTNETIRQIVKERYAISIDKETPMDLSDLDTSEVTDMSSLFYGAKHIDIKGLDKWDTSNVKEIYCMFACSKLQNVGDLSQWDVSSVESMSSMFACSELQSVGDLSRWDTSNVVDMDRMFIDSKLPFKVENNKIVKIGIDSNLNYEAIINALKSKLPSSIESDEIDTDTLINFINNAL